jgi:hypothetical protein
MNEILKFKIMIFIINFMNYKKIHLIINKINNKILFNLIKIQKFNNYFKKKCKKICKN